MDHAGQCHSCDQRQSGTSAIDKGHGGDASVEGHSMNTSPPDHFFHYTFCEDKRENSAHTSMFLQTLNLKSKDMSRRRISHTEEDAVDSASHAYEQVNVDTFIGSSSNLERYTYDTTPNQESVGDSRYPNFLTDDLRQSDNNFKSESDIYNESENQNSLGKTLATSLHLIAASDSHALPPPVDSPLPDSMGIAEHPPSTIEPSGPNSNDSVTSTTPESVSIPLPSRYRTRSIAVSDKTAPFKEETLTQGNAKKENKEERISSTEEDSFYTCDQCGKIFHKKQTLKQHFITHTDRFACSFCHVRCKSKGDLRSHTQTHTKEKPFHCEVCNTNYTRESILKKHKTTQLHKSACIKLERKQMLLSKRDKRPPSELKCVTPKRHVIKKRRLICKRCFKVCLSRKELKRHSRIHGFIYACTKCEKKCKTALHMKIHKRCHFRPNALSCRLCSRSFSTAAMLKDHVKSHYRQNDKYYRTDPKCRERKCESQGRHSMTETKRNAKKSKKEKEILICQTCPRRFKSPKAFERHCAKHATLSEQTKSSESKTIDVTDVSPNAKVNDCDGHASDCNESTATLSTTENLCTSGTDVHSVQSIICQICYSVFSNTGEYKNHVQNHTPTMLFSGESLGDSTITTASKKFSRRCATNRTNLPDACDRESKTSANITKVINNTKMEGKLDSGAENIMDCFDFIKLLKTLVEESSDEGGADDDGDDDESSDALYRGLQNLFCINKSKCSDENKTASCSINTSLLKDQSSIDYQSLLDNHTIQDVQNHIYKCLLCSASFPKDGQLIEHVKSHACYVCNEFFVDEKVLTEHKANHDISQEKEQLEMQVFPDEESSMSEEEANDIFLDELESVLDCEMKSNTQVDFLHTFSHDEIVKANKKIFERYSCIDVPTNIYACTICKRKYARPTTLTRHFKTHVCHYCNKFFIDKSDLLEHKYKHRQKAALLKAEISGEQSCKILNSPLLSKANRELFKKYTFIDSSRNINKCCLCDKTFVRKTVLTRHMKTHICSYCDKFYEDKYELARHVGIHKIEAQVSEDGGETREYNDYDDEKPFTSRSALRDPLESDDKVVTIDPTFSSSLPHFSSTFTNPGGGAHETLTFIEIPVSDNCDNTNNVTFGDGNETVTSTYQIISDSIDAYKESAHESFIVDGAGCQADDPSKMITIAQGQIMADDRNQDRLNLFECTLCGKTFFKSGHLKSHMSTHSVRKPHVCHLCGKSFVRRGALKRHEKNHDIKRCKFCETTFNFQFELDDHMQMHDSYSFYK